MHRLTNPKSIAWRLPILGALLAATFGSNVALAQGRMAMGGGERSSPADYRSVLVSLPIISLSPEAVGRVEFNLVGKGTLAIEGMAMGPHDQIDPKVHSQTGETLLASGRGAALFLARYTQPISMAGFYYGFGVGYREEAMKWRVKPEAGVRPAKLSLLDQGQMLNHDASLHGPTGHARCGYRYVSTDVPFTIGGYLGVRHFQASAADVDHNAADTTSENVTYSPLSDSERAKLIRRSATAPEVGVEVGLVF